MQYDSHSSNGLLEQAEQAMQRLAIPNGPSDKVVSDLLTRLDSTAAVSQRPTISLSSIRSRGYVALVALAATVAIVMLQFPKSTFALGDLAEAIRKAKTLSYQVVMDKIDDATTQSPREPKGHWKMLYKDPGLTRTEHSDGMVSVTDLTKNKIMTLVPSIKRATTIDLNIVNDAGGMPETTLSSFPIGLLEHGIASGKPIADKTIDGKVAKGFEVQAGGSTLNIWGDPTTKLPVLMEQKVSLGDDYYLLTMKDFEFGMELSDDLFSTDVPQDYISENSSFPKVDMASVSQLPEIHVAKILKAYSGRFDGKFPKQIDDPGLTAHFGATFGSDVEGYKTFLADLIPSMGASWIFRTSLKNFGYSGDAKIGEAKKIVFWYMPEGATQYRVVYGDLRIGDVDSDQIPKVVK